MGVCGEKAAKVPLTAAATAAAALLCLHLPHPLPLALPTFPLPLAPSKAGTVTWSSGTENRNFDTLRAALPHCVARDLIAQIKQVFRSYRGGTGRGGEGNETVLATQGVTIDMPCA